MLDPKKIAALVLAALTFAADAGAQMADEDPHEDAPRGHGGGGVPGQPPEDAAMDAPSLPDGQLQIMVVDAENKPLPGTHVTLGIVYNSVAKGESRKRLSFVTDASGVATAEHLEGGSGVAYRPSVATGDATFAVMPFRMPDKGGMRAILHVYPTTDDVEKALIVAQSIVYAEVKDDRVQIQQMLRVFNFGKNAWVPRDLVIPLPEEFTAFTTQQGMTDVGVDAVPKKGVKLRGTLGPGRHDVEWRWQLPYAGEAEVKLTVGMAPHMANVQVIAPASREMTLEVPGFPPPQSRSDGQGQRALVTEKQAAKSDSAIRSVDVIIRGLPTEGPGKIIATMLSGAGLLFGLVLGTRRPTKADRKSERARLLAQLEELERARHTGDVGPKTYERARRELLDALARTFIEDAPTAPAASKKRSK
ncbi:MAG: hypothetical protein KIT84_05270 [Labilithrix sp.]|nr:hypothetical protein [Labilithrix sp.]MCW5810397.1 hypothetical protein [Labilithrix sp.]